jgi:hypothetical protein
MSLGAKAAAPSADVLPALILEEFFIQRSAMLDTVSPFEGGAGMSPRL